VILAEYFEIWIIESNLNGYCLNCTESQSSGPGWINLEINLDFVRSKNERHDVLQQNSAILFSLSFLSL
jgi:hypothetical protein